MQHVYMLLLSSSTEFGFPGEVGFIYVSALRCVVMNYIVNYTIIVCCCRYYVHIKQCSTVES